jgi:N-acetyl-1-D-myo-inositol-2-amino-2-deoxy-alpha-D-glucopyranoside deacetylase
MKTRVSSLLHNISSPWGRVVLILAGLGAAVIIARQLALPNTTVPLADLQPFSLAGYHRLLILAPHCDDETLSSAGLILAAERLGIQVRVVIATNGDGFFFATLRDFHKLYPTHADYIRLGIMRQKESLSALAILGVKADQVTFLSYPDRGTPALWNTDWSPAKPYRSPFSGDTKSPYPLTYNVRSVYAGVDYLADLSSIIDDYHPDLIVYPHPDDVHPDHWGLNAFTRLAITLLRHKDPSWQTTELTYLVHRPDYPEIRGYLPQDNLTPPGELYSIDPNWYRLDLTPSDVAIKAQAVQAYRTQLPLLGNLMESFVRTNETFAPVSYPALAQVAQGNVRNPSTWLDPQGKLIPPIQLDPTGDYITRVALPAGDLTAIFAASDLHANLQFCAEAVEETTPAVVYILRLKALTATGVGLFQARTGPAPAGWVLVHRSGAYVCASYSLAELGNPWAIFMGATTETGGRIMDETAWQMVYVKP